MRLVHLADVHLGYRQYQRLTPAGINQREADVAGTFRRALDKVIELRPDIVLIAGDVFHSSRPTNSAILFAFQQLQRLTMALPQATVVMIAGDHDQPRSSETGSIMKLFEAAGVHVATEPRWVSAGDVAVFAVPDGPLPALLPDASKRHNVLLIHADVEDVIPRYYAELDRAAARLTRRDLDPSRWTYVALGHYHVHQQVAPNAWYAGSLDYTSLNVWYDLEEEDKQRKGLIEYDLDAGTHTFHTVAPARELMQREVKAATMTPAEVDAAIRRAVERIPGGIDDRIVRIVVRDIPRQVARELDFRAIREYKRRALSFLLDTRRPEATRRVASGAPARRPSVMEVVRERLQDRPIPADLDRGRLVELGMQYLTDVDVVPAAVVADAPPET